MTTPQLETGLATPDRWADVQHALTGGGDGRTCWCCWPVMPGPQWRSASVDERRDALHSEIVTGPAPGIVCYVDGQAIGWVRVGPRPHQLGLVRTRIVKSGAPDVAQDTSVWGLTCFCVRKEGRGMGVSRTLLDAAVDYARTSGARLLEAYPFDNRTNHFSANELFVGALTTFLDAGFTIRARPTPKRVVVELSLE